MNGQRERWDGIDAEVDDKLHSLDVIRLWPAESRQPASWIVHVHHEPDEVSDEQLVWEDVAPWQRVIATREFESREWPVPHTASVRSVIRYHVPESAATTLDELGLSIEVDRDAGLVTTLGPDLPTNLLTLNLMHDVLSGTIAPADARRRYAEVTTTPPDGHPAAEKVKCRFDDVPPTEPHAVPSSDNPNTPQAPAVPGAPGAPAAGHAGATTADRTGP